MNHPKIAPLREAPRLFAEYSGAPSMVRPGAAPSAPASAPRLVEPACATLGTEVGEAILSVFERARNPNDAFELRNLYIGQVEDRLGARGRRPELAARWRESRKQRTVSSDDVLGSRATATFVKELFNWFFRDDLYGLLRASDHLILSSGSVDETRYGLPDALKSCVRYALDRDWYGYSDSRGREATRDAIAELENAGAGVAHYERANVVVTLGGTAAISSVVELLKARSNLGGRAVVALPNYPPLVQAVAQRFSIKLTPLPCRDGVTHLAPLASALESDTPLVVLQTVTNPTGTRVDADALEAFLERVPSSTMVLLDECHDCLGPPSPPSAAQLRPNVIRVKSLSKSHAAPGLKIGWMLASAELVSEFYEHASTSYGSPPSIFYLLTEMLARFELWRLGNVVEPGARELQQFESEYGLRVNELRSAYWSYCADRGRREGELIELRHTAVERCAATCEGIIPPRYSLNIAISPLREENDYVQFRRLLADEGVALYPGVLAFCLNGTWLRMSPAIGRGPLGQALARFERFLDRAQTAPPVRVDRESEPAGEDATESAASEAFGALLEATQPGRCVRPRAPDDTARWAAELLAKVRERSDDVVRALRGYTTAPNVADELSRVEYLLSAIAVRPEVFAGSVPRGAGFMPRNQLLYSSFYMGVVVARLCDELVLRPPRAAHRYVKTLFEVLDLATSAPGVRLFDGTYRAFIERHAIGADVVVFTGASETATLVRSALTGAELFLASGSGHNPIVVFAGADLEDAARRIVRLALYNQGQDCAAPSTILCAQSLVASLREAVCRELASLQADDAGRPAWERVVGPNTDRDHVRKVAAWFAALGERIVHGGEVDSERAIVQPTVIVSPLENGALYHEWFAPVVAIQGYASKEALFGYFADERYARNAMYVTLLGPPDDVYVGGRAFGVHPPPTVLVDTDLHTHERGDQAYGGYGSDASFVAMAGKRVAMPILPHREVARLVVARSMHAARSILGSERTHANGELHAALRALPAGAHGGRDARVAGRVVAIRNGGMFFDAFDGTAKLQLFVDPARGAVRDALRELAAGDHVAAEGELRRTARGELTLDVTSARVISKSGRGRRPIDPRERDLERARGRVAKAARRHLEDDGYLEIAPPAPPPDPGPLRALARGVSDRVFGVARGALEAHILYADDAAMRAVLEALLSAVGVAAQNLPLVSLAGGTPANGSWQRHAWRVVAERGLVAAHVVDLPTDAAPFARRAARSSLAAESWTFVQGVLVARAWANFDDPAELRARVSERLADFAADREVELRRELELGVPPSAGLRLDLDAIARLGSDA